MRDATELDSQNVAPTDSNSQNNGEPKDAGSANAFSYPINGLRVKFPFKPYASQLAMMDRVIRALNDKGKHALLESPTGSGKTLALLCAVSAWLEDQCQRANSNDTRPGTLLEPQKGRSTSIPKEPPFDIDAEAAPMHRPLPPVFDQDNSMDQDFSDFTGAPSNCNSCSESGKAADQKDLPIETFQLPKIYFCTRTHKQIAQVVRELKRTGYDARYTVLASRRHYCIQKDVREAKDISDACRDAIVSKVSKSKCEYYHRLSKIGVYDQRFSINMDVEDLVKYSKSARVCPYFLSREAANHSEIILCPYNYIIDPAIRETMNIELDNAVIIVDEAHNVEDVARSSGSFELSQETVFLMQQELALLLDNPEGLANSTAHQNMGHVTAVLMNWMNNLSDLEGAAAGTPGNHKSFRSFESNIDIFEGQGLVDELQHLGLTRVTIESWAKDVEKISESSFKIFTAQMGRGADLDCGKERCLSTGFIKILSSLFSTLKNIFKDERRNLNAFRLVRYDTVKLDPLRNNIRRRESTMGFWCLSSEVIFEEISQKAKAIILTSGTLSPMDTFASELQTAFPLQLEAQHVIEASQLFVGTFAAGPSGGNLIGTYQNTSSFTYQDDVAQCIYQICQVTPFGVLCFLPSYALLDKLLDRMQATGVYEKLARLKEVISEPKSGSTDDFERLMKRFYRTIADCKQHGGSAAATGPGRRHAVTGAVLFAVYRGKVSEGLDFADEHARAVINIGIPYPAFKDQKVLLKKEYNDRHVGSKQLLPGSQWYEIQAFRALNQALGRCIRHRHDWGAVVFLDQRFTHPKNIQKLSKWVRPSVRGYSALGEGIAALRAFMKGKGAALPEELVLEAAPQQPAGPARAPAPLPGRKRLVDFDEDDADAAPAPPPARAPASAAPPSGISLFFQSKKTLGARPKRPASEE